MVISFLTSEDVQSITNELTEIRMLMNEVGRDVGKMMQLRTELEEMVSIASTLNKTLTSFQKTLPRRKQTKKR